MPTPKDIEQQQNLLSAHRETLAHYLIQQARLGKGYAPPGITAGIREARKEIERVKTILRNWEERVEDLPDDTDDFFEPNVTVRLQSEVRQGSPQVSYNIMRGVSDTRTGKTEDIPPNDAAIIVSDEVNNEEIYLEEKKIFISSNTIRLGDLTVNVRDVYSASFVRDIAVVTSSLAFALVFSIGFLVTYFYYISPTLVMCFGVMSIFLVIVAINPSYNIQIVMHNGTETSESIYTKEKSIRIIKAINKAKLKYK